MIIKREDLKLKRRYGWNANLVNNRNSKFFGDHLDFARHDGNHVLFLINKLLDQHGALVCRRTIKIEEMLIFLPEKRLSHIQVKEWILQQWNKGLKLK